MPRLFIKQEGSTCWFHSIMNGFLLSTIGRRFLKKIINGPSASLNSCPTKSASKVQLLSHLARYLREGVSDSDNNISMFFPFKKGIGGTKKDYISLCLKLFPDYIDNKILFNDDSGNYTQDLPFDLQRYKDGAIISHSYISSIGEHAITGARDEKGFFVFDSNFTEPIRINWTTEAGQKQLIKHFETYYEIKKVKLNIVSTYIHLDFEKTNNSELRKLLDQLENIKYNYAYGGGGNLKKLEILKQIKNRKNALKRGPPRRLTPLVRPKTPNRRNVPTVRPKTPNRPNVPTVRPKTPNGLIPQFVRPTYTLIHVFPGRRLPTFTAKRSVYV